MAWPPGGFNARLYAEAAKLVPDMDETGGPDPEDWGDEAIVRGLLAPHASGVNVRQGVLARRAASAGSLWSEAADHVPVLQALRQMVTPADFDSFGHRYQRVVDDCARPEGDGIVLEIGYTVAVATVA